MSNNKEKNISHLDNLNINKENFINSEDYKIDDSFINDILKHDHPFKIITEFCNKFKSSPIVKVVETIKPVSQFITYITIFNNISAEGIGQTKKKSKSKIFLNFRKCFY